MTRASVRAFVRGAPRALFASLLLIATSLGGGCEGHGEFRITWRFADGDVTSAGDCSRRGVERVVITFENDRGGTVKRFEFPCGRGDSKVRTVPEGTYQVRVQAFGPSGLPFTDPETGETALIHFLTGFQVTDDDGVTEQQVVFTPNPPCADFVDNDGDGLVDAADPGCLDKDGDYDPDPARGEEDDQGPGVLAVSWQINQGRDGCDEVQPAGAPGASVVVDGLEAARFDCVAGSGELTLAAGPHSVALRLLDPDEQVLATTPSRDITLIQDTTETLEFDVAPADFDSPQTGELRLTLEWGSAGQSCGDASPMVADQSLLLLDEADQVVDATLVGGQTLDDTAGQCVDASTIQRVDGLLPVGDYFLSVTGYEAGGAGCWQLPELAVRVDIGPNPLWELVVPTVDATGACAP
jgi:hypothetical protein